MSEPIVRYRYLLREIIRCEFDGLGLVSWAIDGKPIVYGPPVIMRSPARSLLLSRQRFAARLALQRDTNEAVSWAMLNLNSPEPVREVIERGRDAADKLIEWELHVARGATGPWELFEAVRVAGSSLAWISPTVVIAE
jgi:hypothetical protein